MKKILAWIGDKKVMVLADQAIFSGASLASTLLVARLLPINEFGLYSAVFLWLYLLTSITSALTSQPFQVSYARHGNSNIYLRFVASFQMVITGGLAIISVFTMNLVFDEFRPHLPVITFLGIGFLMHDFNRKVLLTKDRVKQVVLLDGLMAATLCLFLGIALGNDKFELTDALFLTGFSFAIPALVGVFFLRYGMATWSDWDEHFKNHWLESKWLLMSAGIQWCSANVFIVASGVFLGPVALGAFRLVQSMFGILNLLLQTFENYALPQASRMFHLSIDDSKRYLRQISLKTAAWFITILLVLFIFSESIIVSAGGEQYRPFAYVIKGMVILYTIIYLGYPVRMAVRLLVLNRIFFAGYLITFLISLVSFRLLLNQWHLWGAIIGLIVNQVVLIIFWQYHLNKKAFSIWK